MGFLKSRVDCTKIAKAGPGFDDPPEHPSGLGLEKSCFETTKFLNCPL